MKPSSPAWRVRGALLLALPLAGGAACAALTGLDQYESNPETRAAADDDSASSVSEATGEAQPEASPSTDAANFADDGPGADDADSEAGSADAPETADVVEAQDAPPSDASGIPDNFVCSPSTCQGCCNSAGDCVGGQSVGTCGTGGHACTDCTSTGACAAGKCASPPPDATAPAMCVAGKCPNNCVTGLQDVCCKADQTCGCQWSPFAGCM